MSRGLGTSGSRATLLVVVALLTAAASAAEGADANAELAAEANAGEAISYYREVLPILRARCHGCHQPARAKGGYEMSSHAALVAGGDAEEPAIVPGDPDASLLVDQITPVDGESEMPRKRKPLGADEIARIRRWISEGALDDTPEDAHRRFDAENPPVYSRPPVITSLDFSPDGETLAVSGFHEVVLMKADGSERLGRLIGLSERIESVRFSPDGMRLVVAGGLPAHMGELQIWDVGSRELKLSLPLTHDTLYGASWSPDGKSVAFGCADNTVRIVNAADGKETLFQLAHDDWVFATAFTVDGKHLVSAGRDRSAKLIEVDTERFVDNITSITPGALKGGIAAIARHPERDELVIGGADGVPRIYRIFRLTKRVIGDDATLVRVLPELTGRVTDVAVSPDGKRIAAVSSLDGRGQAAIYSYELDTALPENLRKIMSKVINQRTAAEKKALADYRSQDVRRIALIDVPESGLYAVSFRPDGAAVAVAGTDGEVRILETETGQLMASFSPAEVAGETRARLAAPHLDRGPGGDVEREMLPASAVANALSAHPSSIELVGDLDYAQLLVTATFADGSTADATRMVTAEWSSPMGAVDSFGIVRPLRDGEATLRLRLGQLSVEVPVSVSGLDAPRPVDFVRDVNPVLSRVGCNAGTCHGSAVGQAGFKLSLRGYDAIADVRALTDDLAARRVNLASPLQSLMLRKPTALVPHEGGQVIEAGSPYYLALARWIARGAQLDVSSARVASIEVLPAAPVLQRVGDRQQIRVEATYPDGSVRDVTREAILSSSDAEVATVDESVGLVTALRRGEAAILARYEGAYAAAAVTVMGDREGFSWQPPETHGRIDELVAEKWRRMKIQPSELCTDFEFLRRVSLDLTGLPPTAGDVRAFLADERNTRTKREELIDRLIGSDAYVDHWTNKWADLLQVNRKFLGVAGAASFRGWIREQVAGNTPYDELTRKILTAQGSNQSNPAASYVKILREPTALMENTTHLFLSTRFNCNKCHDHPFERWTQDQYYETSAWFAHVGLKRDGMSDKNIGGTAVEGATPEYEIVFDTDEGEVTHARTGAVVAPRFPFAVEHEAPEGASRRERLAAWLTSPSNPYFARSHVNRLWGYLFGVGIIQPIDDIRAGNPPSNGALLDYLTDELVEHGFDVRHVQRLICKSRVYQLSFRSNRWNEDDRTNYSRSLPRRLPAEVLLDSVHRVTGSISRFPGVPEGTRAAALPDAGVDLPGGFLAQLGRPARQSTCECERRSDLQLGAVMALINGKAIDDAISDPKSELARLVAEETDDEKLIDELVMRILGRPARQEEIAAVLESSRDIESDHERVVAALAEREAWAAPIHEKREAERTEALAATQKLIGPHEEAYGVLEARRAEEVAKLEEALAAYQAEELPAKMVAWEKSHVAGGAAWSPLFPESLASTNGATLTPLPDSSVRVTGKKGTTVTTMVARTDLVGLSGLRFEAMTDPDQPSGGPGRAPNGNFVLTELELFLAPAAEPENETRVELHRPLADFSQQDYPVALVIDGVTNNRKGWAIHPRPGVTHWATFETKLGVGFAGGTIVTIRLTQKFDGEHTLGRFRVSVTAGKSPIGLSLSDELRAAIFTPQDARTKEQRATLLTLYRFSDEALRQHQGAVDAARKPTPVPPGLQQLRNQLAAVSRPVPLDPLLVRLRTDIDVSRKQLEANRLTMAQDLAWAFINSPSFLFNH